MWINNFTRIHRCSDNRRSQLCMDTQFKQHMHIGLQRCKHTSNPFIKQHNKHITQISFFSLLKIFTSGNQTQVWSSLLRIEILTLKNKTPSTSLICLFKLNCYSHPKWSYDRKQTTTKDDENVLITINNLWLDLHTGSHDPPSFLSMLTNYDSTKIPKICHNMWPTHHIVGMPRCYCITSITWLILYWHLSN